MKRVFENEFLERENILFFFLFFFNSKTIKQLNGTPRSTFLSTRNVSDVTWRLFTCVRAHVGIGDYVSRLRARPELESAGLHDKTRPARAKGRVFRFQRAKGTGRVLSYEPSVTQAA